MMSVPLSTSFHRLPIIALSAGLCLASHFLPSRAAGADLVIRPATLEVDFDEGRPKGRFVLVNAGEELQRFRARAIHFTLSEAGAFGFASPDDLSLASWVRFNPTEFDIPAGGQRTIRYAIIPPGEIGEGEYWGAIEFEPLEGTEHTSEDGDGRTFKITIVASAIAPIFGTKGDVRYEVGVVEANLEREGEGDGVLVLRIPNSSSGRIHVTGTFRLTGEGGAEIASGPIGPPRLPILRGGARIVRVPVGGAVSPGEYALHLVLKVDQLDAPVTVDRVVALR